MISYDRAAEGLLGGATTRRRACARATMSAPTYRSGHLRARRDAASGSDGSLDCAALQLTGGAGRRRASTAGSRPEIVDGRPLLLSPRIITSSIWPRTPAATAACAAPAWPARANRLSDFAPAFPCRRCVIDVGFCFQPCKDEVLPVGFRPVGSAGLPARAAGGPTKINSNKQGCTS